MTVLQLPTGMDINWVAVPKGKPSGWLIENDPPTQQASPPPEAVVNIPAQQTPLLLELATPGGEGGQVCIGN